MKQPLYLTLRAFGQGAIYGTLAAIPLGLAVVYLRPAWFFGLALAVGAGAIVMANVLQRHARRASNGGETK